MKSYVFKLAIPAALAAIVTSTWLLTGDRPASVHKSGPPAVEQAEAKPNDWFFRQRAFPYDDIPYKAWHRALRQSQSFKGRHTLAGAAEWQFAGPLNIGGRITDVEMSPTSLDTIYIGAASGGVFRSVDGGQNWRPILDEALSLSIGDLALCAKDPRTIYVGTGEPNGGGGSLTYGGFGVYKSKDAGESWRHVGLEETRFIGRVAVDPDDSQRVFVAAMGNLFSKNPERGLYRSLDGGESWELVLFLSDSTGCVDVAIHPGNPDTVYAAMWERQRFPHDRRYGGITSGVYRSVDGGDTWQELTVGLPNNSPNVGRIGLDISASNPNIIYAIYADRTGFFSGVYKTLDSGDTWTRTNDSVLSSLYSSFGWWFGNIRVDPADADIVYVLGLPIYKTIDGGQSWQWASGNIHVDQHGMVIHPLDHNFVVVGNDGGVYTSRNGGGLWTKKPNLPLTQFYTCEIDEQQPQRLYGGTQDNGSNRTLTGALSDWQHIFGGDGFYVLVDPTDNRFVYAESQFGNLGRSVDGGATFASARSGISGQDRRNWNTPVVFNPLNPKSLYYGASRLYKSTNRAVSWTAISPDVSTGGIPGNSSYGAITTIAVAASDTNVIYVGTDDGNVQVTQDDGDTWTLISADLPLRWVTRVAVDPEDAHTAYVTISGFRYDSFLPHIFRTEDAGQTWQDISGDLPESPLNDVIVNPNDHSTLYVASDVGVFVTRDTGNSWQPLGAGLPNVPVTDLDLHEPTNMLVAATYGRSMYKIALEPATSVAASEQPQQREAISLLQNYPNPFNAGTTIRYRLKESSQVQLEVFDLTGRLVRRLMDASQPAGDYHINWDGTDGQGRSVASGTYVYRLRTEQRMEVRRMVLVR